MLYKQDIQSYQTTVFELGCTGQCICDPVFHMGGLTPLLKYF